MPYVHDMGLSGPNLRCGRNDGVVLDGPQSAMGEECRDGAATWLTGRRGPMQPAGPQGAWPGCGDI